MTDRPTDIVTFVQNCKAILILIHLERRLRQRQWGNGGGDGAMRGGNGGGGKWESGAMGRQREAMGAAGDNHRQI